MNMKTTGLVVCDEDGNACEVPGLLMVGASNGALVMPDEKSLITLPESSLLFSMPSRIPVGYDPVQRRYVEVMEYCGRPVTAAAAFMPPGYMQTFTSAYRERPGAPLLPLFSYTAVGWQCGRFYAAGRRVDRRRLHAIPDRLLPLIDRRGRALLRRFPRNRLIGHLVNNCVLKYRCPVRRPTPSITGGPVPVSQVCNAACIGCISHQPKSSCVPSTQHRLDFTPTVREIIEYVIPHLKSASRPVASFGQGCEGEPLMQAGLVEEAVRAIRSKTGRGMLNINTNASRPDAVERLCRAGMSSMRVSLNSAQSAFYHAYYRPREYSFSNVAESIAIAKRHGIRVSLNYLVFPGFTDTRAEMAALKRLLRKPGADMIQTRNLNIDPMWYSRELGIAGQGEKAIGMVRWISEIRSEFPEVGFGYFNPAF